MPGVTDVERVVFASFGVLNVLRFLQILRAPTWLDNVAFKINTVVVLSHIAMAIPVLFLPLFIPNGREDDAKSLVVFWCNPLAIPIFVVSVLGLQRTRNASIFSFWASTTILVAGTQISAFVSGLRGLAWACSVASFMGFVIAVRRLCKRRFTALPVVHAQSDNRAPRPSRTDGCIVCDLRPTNPFPRSGASVSQTSTMGAAAAQVNLKCFGIQMLRIRDLEGMRVCPVTHGQQPEREPIERGIFWLKGNPGDMYANMTQLAFSDDGTFASLDAQHILFPDGGLRFSIVYSLLIPLLNYSVVFDFRSDTSGMCSNSLLGMHIPFSWLNWKVCVRSRRHIVRQSWDVHRYDAVLIYKMARSRLAPTHHFRTLVSALEDGRETDDLLTWKETCVRARVFLHPRLTRALVSPLVDLAHRALAPALLPTALSSMSCSHRSARLCEKLGRSDSLTSAEVDVLILRIICVDCLNVDVAHDHALAWLKNRQAASMGLTDEQAARAGAEFSRRRRAYRFCIAALRSEPVRRHVSEHGASDGAVYEAYRHHARKGTRTWIDVFSSRAAKEDCQEWHVEHVVDSRALGRAVLHGGSERIFAWPTIQLDVDVCIVRRAFAFSLCLVGVYQRLPVDALAQTLCLPHVIFASIIFRYLSFIARDAACPFHGQVADLVLLWTCLLNPTLRTDHRVVMRVADALRLCFGSIVLERVVHEGTGRTSSLVAGVLQFVACAVIGSVDVWYLHVLAVILMCARAFARIPKSKPITMVAEKVHCDYMPLRGERHFVFQADPINLVVIAVIVLLGHLFVPQQYGEFLRDNAIRRRIGFNNMCVFFDLFPFSSLAGLLLFGNVIGRFGQFLFLSSHVTVTWSVIAFIPYYLLIFMITPETSLLFHSVGYVLFIGGEITYMVLSMSTLRWIVRVPYVIALVGVGVYGCLAVVALGTDITLPPRLLVLGQIMDTLIFVALVVMFVVNLSGISAVYAVHVHVVL